MLKRLLTPLEQEDMCGMLGNVCQKAQRYLTSASDPAATRKLLAHDRIVLFAAVSEARELLKTLKTKENTKWKTLRRLVRGFKSLKTT